MFSQFFLDILRYLAFTVQKLLKHVLFHPNVFVFVQLGLRRFLFSQLKGNPPCPQLTAPPCPQRVLG